LGEGFGFLMFLVIGQFQSGPFQILKKENPKNISVLGFMATIKLINMNHNKYHYKKKCPYRPSDFIGF
jgi:hypothetical protein